MKVRQARRLLADMDGAGWTQKMFAEAVGCSLRTIQRHFSVENEDEPIDPIFAALLQTWHDFPESVPYAVRRRVAQVEGEPRPRKVDRRGARRNGRHRK